MSDYRLDSLCSKGSPDSDRPSNPNTPIQSHTTCSFFKYSRLNSYRQFGQVQFRESHISKHSLWNKCLNHTITLTTYLHGVNRTLLLCSKLSRHTVHGSINYLQHIITQTSLTSLTRSCKSRMAAPAYSNLFDPELIHSGSYFSLSRNSVPVKSLNYKNKIKLPISCNTSKTIVCAENTPTTKSLSIRKHQIQQLRYCRGLYYPLLVFNSMKS